MADDHPLEAYRPLFPAAARYAYLNHASVAPLSTRARAAAVSWFDALTEHGVVGERAWEERAEAARARVARLLGADAGEVAFVRSTSHGLGLFAAGLDWRPGDEVAVCRALEYPSNVYPWEHLADRGVVVRDVEPDGLGVSARAVERALTGRTRLVSVSSVQYATGHRTDLEAVGRLCRDAGALFCVDAIQSLGAFPLDVRKCHVDLLSADSHKWLLGMPGAGVAYVRREALARLRPPLVGWKSTREAWNFDRPLFQLRDDAAKLEEGSHLYAGIYAIDAAVELLLEVGVERAAARIAELLAKLDAGLRAAGCDVSPGPGERAGILTFVPPGGDAATLSDRARDAGVCVTLRRGRIRVSPHFYNNEADLDALLALVR